ncbi:hypothetical protein ACWEQL_28235 [Kitasatospora sp. NPDC004240]
MVGSRPEAGGARGEGGVPGDRLLSDTWPAVSGRPVLRRSIAVGLVLCVAFTGVVLVRGISALSADRVAPETDRDRAERLAGLHPSQHPGAGRYYVPVGAVYTHTQDGAPVAYLHYRLSGGHDVDVADFLRTYDLPAPGPRTALPADLTAALAGEEPEEVQEILATAAAVATPTSVPAPTPSTGAAASPTATVSPPVPGAPPGASAGATPEATSEASPGATEGASGEEAEDEEGDCPDDRPEPSADPMVGATAGATAGPGPTLASVTATARPAPMRIHAPEVRESPSAEPPAGPPAGAGPGPTAAPTADPTPTVSPSAQPFAVRRIYVAPATTGLPGAADIYVRAGG